MTARNLGAILRLVGVIIELACLTLLFRKEIDTVSIGSVEARTLLYVGFGVGFLFVMTGIALSLVRPSPRR